MNSLETSKRSVLQPLVGTIGPAIVVYLFLIVVALLSFTAFFYQYQHEIEPGIRYIDFLPGMLSVWAHGVRGAACSILAVALHHYLRGIRAMRRKDEDGEIKVVAAMALFWKAFATSAVILVALGIWSILITLNTLGGPREAETYLASQIPEVTVEFRLAELHSEDDLEEAVIPSSGHSVWLYPDPILTQRDIARASVVRTLRGPEIGVSFTPEGEAALSAATKHHQNRPMAILVDGQVVCVPTIEAEIGSSMMIRMDRSTEELQQIARSLSGRK